MTQFLHFLAPFLVALTLVTFAWMLLLFTDPEPGRHAGSWRPLPHRSGSLLRSPETPALAEAVA